MSCPDCFRKASRDYDQHAFIKNYQPTAARSRMIQSSFSCSELPFGLKWNSEKIILTKTVLWFQTVDNIEYYCKVSNQTPLGYEIQVYAHNYPTQS